MATWVVSFGFSTFSKVFCQVATTPTSPIATDQFCTLPPCSLVHCRRTVWYIAAVRFGSSSSITTQAPLAIDLTQRDRRIVWYIAAVQFGTFLNVEKAKGLAGS